jgi:hypothetical protein
MQNVTYSVAPVQNAYDYHWSFPAGTEVVSGGNTSHVVVNYTPNSVSGIISVYGSNGNCLGAASPDFVLTVNPVPATPTITKVGDTVISSAAEGNQWFLDGVAIQGATNQKHVAVFSGTYTVMVTLNGCSSAISAGIFVQPVAIAYPAQQSKVHILPNPSAGYVKVSTEFFDEMKLSVKVFDSQSVMVKYLPEINNENGRFELDLSSLPSGFYTITIAGNKRIETAKMLIQK